MPVYISTGAFQTNQLPDILALCQEAGLQGLELSSGLDPIRHVEQWLERASTCGPLLIHNYFPAPERPFVLNLASSAPEVLKRSRAHCERAIHLSASVGAPFYSVHSGFAVDMKVDMLGNPKAQASLLDTSAYEASYARFRDQVDELCRVAEEAGIDLLLENNALTRNNLHDASRPQMLMTRPSEFARLFDELGRSNLGVLMDVGHARVAGHTLGFDPGSFIEALAPHIAAFHLSENDGLSDSNEPVVADSWFLPFLKHFPDAVFVLEVYDLPVSQIIQQLSLISRHLPNDPRSCHAFDSRQHSVLS